MSRRCTWTAAGLVVLALMLAAVLPILPKWLQGSAFYGFELQRPSDLPAELWRSNSGASEPAFTFLFFGFLGCDSVCPSQISNMIALDRLMPSAPVKFRLVTIDPERDSRQQLANLTAELGPRFGWYRPATPQRAQALAASLGETVALARPGQAPDHSAALYVLDAEGVVRLMYFGAGLDLGRVRDDIRRLAEVEVQS